MDGVITMKKKYFVSVVLCVVGLSLLTGCQSLTADQSTEAYKVESNPGPTMISDLIDLSDRLHFPDLENASKELLQESGYVWGLSATEKKYYFNNTELSPNALVQEWTMQEKDKLIKLTMEFENQFDEYGITFEDSIELIKITNATKLPSVFVSGNAVVLNQSAVDTHKDDLKDELVQAYFKLYLTKHPELLDEMTQMIGFEVLPAVNLPEKLMGHIIIRPGMTKPYLYEAARGDIQTSPIFKWMPITFINPETDLAEDYMLAVTLSANGEAVVKTMTSVNKYLPKINPLNEHLAVPLVKLQDAYKVFGELPENYAHPEDILALNFMYLVLERPVTGTGTIDRLKTKLGS